MKLIGLRFVHPVVIQTGVGVIILIQQLVIFSLCLRIVLNKRKTAE